MTGENFNFVSLFVVVVVVLVVFVDVVFVDDVFVDDVFVDDVFVGDVFVDVVFVDVVFVDVVASSVIVWDVFVLAVDFSGIHSKHIPFPAFLPTLLPLLKCSRHDATLHTRHMVIGFCGMNVAQR